jgi:hypothetical protein
MMKDPAAKFQTLTAVCFQPPPRIPHFILINHLIQPGSTRINPSAAPARHTQPLALISA